MMKFDELYRPSRFGQSLRPECEAHTVGLQSRGHYRQYMPNGDGVRLVEDGLQI